ncbi:MAG: fumarylacetoacetate hydrolase family protein [Chitinophagales bacterium]|nr:fumarylacetoacetate hydrolase family protein [Chitinophagaceae bacterium]MCB9064187.1 fumarylacetoacetate hydrolase family protein [Chitinophagales bacterium]
MKIICIGRNYTEHAKELNNEVPDRPVIFMKPKNAILLPNKPFYYPEFTDSLEYECELVVKVCKNGKYIQEKFAHKYYNEVSVGIDITARDLQKQLKEKGLPWELAKAFDASAIVGDFIPITPNMNIQDLHFELKKNGTTVQKGHTKDMLFKINEIVEFISQYITINIGDLIFTGTPAGVGRIDVYDSFDGYLESEHLLHADIR